MEPDTILIEADLRRNAHALLGLAGLIHAIGHGDLDPVRAEDLGFLVEALARANMHAVDAATRALHAA